MYSWLALVPAAKMLLSREVHEKISALELQIFPVPSTGVSSPWIDKGTSLLRDLS